MGHNERRQGACWYSQGFWRLCQHGPWRRYWIVSHNELSFSVFPFFPFSFRVLINKCKTPLFVEMWRFFFTQCFFALVILVFNVMASFFFFLQWLWSARILGILNKLLPFIRTGSWITVFAIAGIIVFDCYTELYLYVTGVRLGCKILLCFYFFQIEVKL